MKNQVPLSSCNAEVEKVGDRRRRRRSKLISKKKKRSHGQNVMRKWMIWIMGIAMKKSQTIRWFQIKMKRKMRKYQMKLIQRNYKDNLPRLKFNRPILWRSKGMSSIGRKTLEMLSKCISRLSTWFQGKSPFIRIRQLPLLNWGDIKNVLEHVIQW